MCTHISMDLVLGDTHVGTSVIRLGASWFRRSVCGMCRDEHGMVHGLLSQSKQATTVPVRTAPRGERPGSAVERTVTGAELQYGPCVPAPPVSFCR